MARVTVLMSALSLAMVAGQAWGQGPKGPRASVLSNTHCSLDLYPLDDGEEPSLVVKTLLTNKSSGNTIPEVRAGSKIKGTYKNRPGPDYEILGIVDIEDILGPDNVPHDVDPTLELTARFALCNPDGSVRVEITGSPGVPPARELNGRAVIKYGISTAGGGDEGETRPVENRCTDDPETEFVDEGGIKVDDATFQEIEDACAALVP